VSGTNGGSLSKKPCYFAFIQAFLPKLPKLLISTVFGVYSGKRDTVKFKQSLLPIWGISFQKTLKEPPFVPDTFNSPQTNGQGDRKQQGVCNSRKKF
jgi:hypothetical protein